MVEPSRAEYVCIALQSLGGTGSIAAIREELVRLGAHGRWVLSDSPDLAVMLGSHEDVYWTRTAPGTFRLTRRGAQKIGWRPSGAGPWGPAPLGTSF